MSILLIRLDGPMQAWGVQSRYGIRDSGREPSKSGVIGLCCAALGRPRQSSIDDLAALTMGVRVDSEGTLLSDFQTIQNYNLKGEVKRTQISTRYYLAGAVFLVALAGNSDLLLEIASAICKPVWSLYLGRKAFLPASPLTLPNNIFDGIDIITSLASYPYLARTKKPDVLRVIIEDAQGEISRPDQPVAFEPRVFTERRVKTLFIPAPQDNLVEEVT